MNTPIYSVLNQARFDFFHSGSGAHSITKPVSLMAQEDKRFLQCPPQYGTCGISEMDPLCTWLCEDQAKRLIKKFLN